MLGWFRAESRSSFRLEAFQRQRIASQLFRKELQGHLTTELEIFGLVSTLMPPPQIFSRIR
jgi:hypothetical protein